MPRFLKFCVGDRALSVNTPTSVLILSMMPETSVLGVDLFLEEVAFFAQSAMMPQSRILAARYREQGCLI